MDDLANLVEDVRYEGELSDPRPKPLELLPLLPEDQIDAALATLQNESPTEEHGLKPLQFEQLMREYLGYYMIKKYLKSIDTEGSVVSMKLDFIEKVDIFQACSNDVVRGPVGISIYNKFLKALNEPYTRRESTIIKAVEDDDKDEEDIRHKRSATQMLNFGETLSIKEWRPMPIRIHVDSKKLNSSLEVYEKFGKTGDNIITVSGTPVQTLWAALNTDEPVKNNIFGELKYIVLCSIWKEHFEGFLESEGIRNYVRYRHIESHEFVEDDFGVFRVLGRGGFGLVNGAKCLFTGKLYAMKVLDKKRIKKSRAEDLCWAERKALGKVRSPFVLNLRYAYQTEESLFLMLDLMTGGDLSFHLRKARHMENELACFYAASVLEGLAHLHSKRIVYRDLKPANVLVDEFGFCALSDLGLAEVLSTKTDPPTTKGRCGTRGYWAPEMITKVDGHSQRYGFSVDWWSFGCFVYELLAGKCPFRTSKALEFAPEPDKAMDKATCEMELEYNEKYFTKDAADLLTKLFDRNPATRIGSGPDGAGELRNHPWFKEIDFGLLELQRVEPPWKPNPNDINAMSQDEIGSFDFVKQGLTSEEQEAWIKWDFTSKSVIQGEVVELLMWEDKVGPCQPPPDDGGCCTIL